MPKGPRYERCGNCLRCGVCCIDEDCEHLFWNEDGTAKCLIFGEEERPERCIWFPQSPPILNEKCGFYFMDKWEENRMVKFGRDL